METFSINNLIFTQLEDVKQINKELILSTKAQTIESGHIIYTLYTIIDTEVHNHETVTVKFASHFIFDKFITKEAILNAISTTNNNLVFSMTLTNETVKSFYYANLPFTIVTI